MGAGMFLVGCSAGLVGGTAEPIAANVHLGARPNADAVPARTEALVPGRVEVLEGGVNASLNLDITARPSPAVCAA